MDKLIYYLRQPSTWKGLIAVGAALGVSISPELTDAIAVAGIASIGVIEVIRNERTN